MIKMKRKLIQFIPAGKDIEGVFDPPVPAKTMLPNWYKMQSGFVSGVKEVTDTGDYNHTVKQCMPALDAMTSGYIITLPQDIEVVDNPEGGASIRWPSDIFKQVSTHSLQQIDQLPLNTDAWDPVAWKFHNPWAIKTPPGYSCLFTAPMWHEDLPFKCFSGVVDTDKYCNQPINFPFVLRQGFRGSIEMGTPIIQVIPFKREDWEHKTKRKSTVDPKQWQKSKRRFGHRYKKDYRTIKDYR